jgi:hypothetical protein
MKRFSMGILAIVAIVSMLTPEQVQARPNYLAAFKETYTKVDTKVVDEKKCGICHGGDPLGMDKKKTSKYATELKTALGKPKVADKDEVVKALKAIESKDAGGGKTYGDLLGAGTLPEPWTK